MDDHTIVRSGVVLSFKAPSMSLSELTKRLVANDIVNASLHNADKKSDEWTTFLAALAANKSLETLTLTWDGEWGDRVQPSPYIVFYEDRLYSILENHHPHVRGIDFAEMADSFGYALSMKNGRPHIV